MVGCGQQRCHTAVLGHVWPSELGVVGRRVSKQLRWDLIHHCTSIIFVQKAGAALVERCVLSSWRVTHRPAQIRTGQQEAKMMIHKAVT
eukprot:1303939-Rhodomonas_salina.1